MSNWVQDIAEMHKKFGVNSTVAQIAETNPHLLFDYLKFRLDMVQEEVSEAHLAFDDRDADGVVDALIDNIVFAIGTLDAFGIDAQTAWERVHNANIVKTPGVKEGRPNKYGFPDLIKPQGWQPPSHKDNVGLIQKAFDNE